MEEFIMAGAGLVLAIGFLSVILVSFPLFSGRSLFGVLSTNLEFTAVNFCLFSGNWAID